MAQCDQRIEKVLAQIPTAKPAATPAPPRPVAAAEPPKQAKRKRVHHGPNASEIDFTQVLTRICGVDLVKVCGLNLLSVLMLIGEIGTDMSRWRSARAFCSWLGLCPASKISGGKVLSRRTRKVNNRASTILRLAAVAVGKTDTWLAACRTWGRSDRWLYGCRVWRESFTKRLEVVALVWERESGVFAVGSEI
jgi:transposase